MPRFSAYRPALTRRGWEVAAFAAFAAALVLCLYGRVLHAPFVFDDAIMIAAPETQTVTLGGVIEVVAAPVPRKLTRASFALNFLAGGLDPFGYHLANLVIHAANGLLLFLLARRLFDLLPADHPWRHRAGTAAFLGATLWLVHPVQIQAVTYVWQRATSLSAFFYLLCVLSYVEARTVAGPRRVIAVCAAAIAGVLALSAKENAGSLPGALALIELCLLREQGVHSMRLAWKPIAAAVAMTLLIAGNYLGPRFVTMMASDFARRGFTLSERLLSESRVVVYYLSLLVLPLPSRLTLDYDIRISHGLLDPWTTLPAVLLVTGLALLGLALWRRAPLLAMAILWFLGLLAIESTVVPLDLAYEHRLYLPSTLPIVFLAAAVIAAWEQDKRARWLLMPASVMAVATLAVWTWQRNEVWRNPVTLWADTAAKSPHKARVHGNLAKVMLEAGNPAAALAEYERAHALDPQLPEPLNAQAVIYLDYFDDAVRARGILADLERRAPAYVPALVNRGVLEMRAGDQAAAARAFSRVIERDARNPVAIYNLAALNVNARRYAEAEARLNDGIRFWPAQPRLRALLALVYLKRGDRARSEETLAIATSLAPSDPMVRALGNELRKLDR
jgi:tetratricopeptide (TPR) repeat protein